MKAFHFVVLTFLLGLTGCAQIQAKIDSDVQAAAVPDVQAALAASTAAGDSEGTACWTDVLAYLNALPTATANAALPQIIGVASALEATRTQNLGTPITIPPIPEQLHKDCAVVYVDAHTLAIKLGLEAAALGKGVGVTKVLLTTPKP